MAGGSMADVLSRLRDIVGVDHVSAAADVDPDDTHDEALTGRPVVPLAVVRPADTDEVSAILSMAHATRLPVVARGAGTGLSGGCRPVADGIVVAFDRMGRILDVDADNQVAVVQPGVTLAQLDEALRPLGLVYPVAPGESSATTGGTVATNAGGMRAVRYGVTRQRVLGLEAVLPGGEVIRTGGRFVKCSSGYDLTQLLVGSEGTLALVTEATLKVEQRLSHAATLLAPFATLEEISRAVPRLVAGGLVPTILEYLDALTMTAITEAAGVDLGVPATVRDVTSAYLVVVAESAREDRLEEDVATFAGLLAELGAIEVYVLPPTAGADLVTARERAFYVSKAAGADDLIDSVVPRAAIPDYLATVATIATERGAFVSGCGHVADGNVHVSIFQPDVDQRQALLHDVYVATIAAGGAISGEHGIGTEKRPYFLELEDPVKLALMRRIKAAFDPFGILGPGRLPGPEPSRAASGEPGTGRLTPAGAEGHRR
jgi:glycolate oxidase